MVLLRGGLGVLVLGVLGVLVLSVARPSLPQETCKMGRVSHTVHYSSSTPPPPPPAGHPVAEAFKAGQLKPRRPPGVSLVHVLRVEEQPALLLRLRPEENRRGGLPPRVLDPPGCHPRLFRVSPVPAEQVAGHTTVPYGVSDGH